MAALLSQWALRPRGMMHRTMIAVPMLEAAIDRCHGIYSNRYAIEPLASAPSFDRCTDGSSCWLPPNYPTECNCIFDDELIAALSVWSLLSHFRCRDCRRSVHSNWHRTRKSSALMPHHHSPHCPIVVAYLTSMCCPASAHIGMRRMSSLANSCQRRCCRRRWVCVDAVPHSARCPHLKMTCMEIIDFVLRDYCHSKWATIVQWLILIVLVRQLIDYWRRLASIFDLNAAPIGSANQWHGLIKYQRRLLRVSICWDLTWFNPANRWEVNWGVLQDDDNRFVCLADCVWVHASMWWKSECVWECDVLFCACA